MMHRSRKAISRYNKKIVRIEIYPALPSTNEYARKLIMEGAASGTVIWALEQTNGRGRRGRSWDSDNSSLTFSVIFQCQNEAVLEILPLTIGLGLVQSLQVLIPELKLKWPNDLWVGHSKLGGILGESIQYEKQLWVILGIGLNVNATPGENHAGRTSLHEVTGRIWPRLGILDLALDGVVHGLSLASAGGEGLSHLFQQYGNFLNRNIIIYQGESSWTAKAIKVLCDGRLLIEDAHGLRAVLPDEISLRFG